MRIDLDGPQGNAYYLMSLVVNLGRQYGLKQEEADEIICEMKSAGYDNLVKVFAKNFGMVIDVYKNGKVYEYEH